MTSAGDVMQMALVAGVPVAVAAASYVGVVRHTAQVPPESPLSSLHGRALATGIVLLLVAAATVNLGFAFEARTRAIALPVGPGWAPDLGLDEIVRAGVWGVIATTLSGLYLLVAAVLDALGARKLKGAGRAAEDVRLFRRALLIDILSLLVCSVLFLAHAGSACSAMMF